MTTITGPVPLCPASAQPCTCFRPFERSCHASAAEQARRSSGWLGDRIPRALTLFGHDFETIEVLRVVVVAVAAALVWFQAVRPVAGLDLVGVAALLFGAWPIFREAIANIKERRMTMELSMSIAIVAAAAISEFFTALVVTFFVLVAEELEHLTVDRGRAAIADLIDVMPHEATVRRDGVIATVPIDTIAVGEHVLVAPGENIPVDGMISSGLSYVDQAHITGESMPIKRSVGDTVFAGSINQSGALDIQVSRIGRDTSFGRIIDAIENAEQSRAPVQRLADQLAGYLVYFSFAAAVVTYLLTGDIRDTISVIIVAGACGVAAGTPLAVLGGIGRAARNGAIIKGGMHLETLGRIDTIVLDKTGTLTFGEPRVLAIHPASGRSEADLLGLAATAELRSEHPLAKAIVAEARARGIAVAEPDSFVYTLGRGVAAQRGDDRILIGSVKLLEAEGIDIPAVHGGDAVSSEVCVAVNGHYAGSFAVADEVRPEAAAAIRELHRLKIRTILLTGDNATVAQSVGAGLGIDTVEAGMLPEQKLARVRALVASGAKVAMLGDGINDAPALTAASVGIAMGSGTDVAKESADIVLLANDLERLVATVRIARRTRGVIWQNFSGTITVDALGIALAAFGFLNPLLAAFIHVSSELIFISNSARLLPAADAMRLPRKAP
ncbi:heavy metal translocating P-type ATPase [Chelatococcus asaccharovorans]|uniref:P-type Zn(2+) transporter n=1 Tax=Chelatococcus asaccharovorans TaxID=28210 RepID=A0A2V3TZV4_9HYPH|nr:cation-translocating P-type ATPase [Chelatococcus asaccharovorans]MBS7707704.1 cation-translocating P-type ATPase [Chelatococcus asaccharovorans]PXW55280.1 Cd2+/Zn2+-exporting ATPase/Cu+-exporting ATPase [Chelatococcus asaccharovorans]